MKRAVVDVVGGILGECATLLTDYGLRIVGSLASPEFLTGCRLIVEGDCLPDACDGRLLMVRAIVSVEVHGSQRLRKITSIEPIGTHIEDGHEYSA